MTARPTGPIRRIGGVAALVLIGTAMLAACGKEGPPKPPSGDDAAYPRSYPSGASVPSDEDAQ